MDQKSEPLCLCPTIYSLIQTSLSIRCAILTGVREHCVADRPSVVATVHVVLPVAHLGPVVPSQSGRAKVPHVIAVRAHEKRRAVADGRDDLAFHTVRGWLFDRLKRACKPGTKYTVRIQGEE